MKVYVVCWAENYEGGEVKAVYSTRELAENSWQWRNKSDYSGWEIIEFELNEDPEADQLDIDRRPVYGCRTQTQTRMDEALKWLFMGNLFETKPLPVYTGNKINFFTISGNKTPPESV